jgi:hypothetical protein
MISDSEFGLEIWQKMFVRSWSSAQEKRNASLPDQEDWDLYDGSQDD